MVKMGFFEKNNFLRGGDKNLFLKKFTWENLFFIKINFA